MYVKLFFLFISKINMNRKTPLVPFQAGSPIMVAGPTASGKT